MKKTLSGITNKIKKVFVERGVNLLVLSVISILISIASFMLGNVSQSYNAYVGLPVRVQALEINIDKVNAMQEDISVIKQTLVSSKTDTQLRDKKLDDLNIKIDSVDNKVNNLTLKLIK